MIPPLSPLSQVHAPSTRRLLLGSLGAREKRAIFYNKCVCAKAGYGSAPRLRALKEI